MNTCLPQLEPVAVTGAETRKIPAGGGRSPRFGARSHTHRFHRFVAKPLGLRLERVNVDVRDPLLLEDQELSKESGGPLERYTTAGGAADSTG